MDVRYKLVSSYARYCIHILMIKVTNYQGFKSIVVGISSGKLLIMATISTGREDNSTSFGHWSGRVCSASEAHCRQRLTDGMPAR